ncbi:complement factor H-like isoform X20 [Ascaphus truei]|uniref:complement factor H-like isoform X20 n=1 Tax=Ascaphus truei TaxID=8439 RepID=UPI003F59625E
MSLVGYLILLTAALCWTVHGAPAPGSCIKPERKQEAELQGVWEDDTYPENTQAIFNCRPGYSRLGSMKYICLRGKWETVGTLGKCRKKSCGDPGDVAFGSFELKLETEFVFGARVVYHCDEGYQMVSRQNTRDCTASGWSNFPPHCEVRRCPPLDVDVGVTVISSSYDDEEFSVGKVIRFECKNPKFGLEGPAEVFCKSEGQWNSPPPICQVISCSTPQISNGNVRIKKETYMENEIMTYACNAKYKPDTRTGVTCTRSGWSPSPSCVEIACYAESVANGEVVKDKDVYREGDIIELKCNRGFKIEYEPDAPRKCTAMGWSPSLKCISLACDRPVIENGRLYYHYYDYQFPQRINRELDYFCKDGFLPPEKSYYGRITCTEDGWSPEPKCLKTCSNNDIRVENADLRRTLNMYVSGEKVQYSCNPGLTTPDGKEGGEIECLPNGKFSPGKCLRECKMSNLDHGSYQTDKNIFEVGEYLRYTCDKGFRSPRNRTTDSAQCLQQGWSVPPQCVEIACYAESVANGAVVKDKDVYREGDIIELTCNRGFKIEYEPDAPRKCTAMGWSPSLKCISLACDRPVIENGHLHYYIYYPTFPQRINIELDYFCKDGYWPPEKTNYGRITCTEDGWSPEPKCLKTCSNNDIRVENADLGRTLNKYVTGEKVQYRCHPGLTTTDGKESGEIECRPNGKFSPGKCLKITCSIESTEKMVYKDGDTLRINCPTGYTLRGSEVSQCYYYGWDPPLPTCEGLGEVCNPPPTVENGDITDSRQPSYRSGSVVEYKCQSYYKLEGNRRVKCENGVWDDPPICLEPCTAGEREMRANNIQLRWTEDKKLYSEHDDEMIFGCLDRFEPSPSAVFRVKCNRGVLLYPKCIKRGSCLLSQETMETNSIFINRSTEIEQGETIEFKCNEGMVPENTLTATCQKKTIIYPKCTTRRVGEVCNPPPTVENGDITYSRQPSYRSGTVVVYKCPSYYKLEGNQRVKCENGVWDDPPICLEPCTAGEREMRANNIQLRWTEDKKLYSEHDDEMEFGCLNGYEPSPSAVFRVKCNRGVLLYPKCIKRGSCLLSQETMETNSIFINRSTEIEQGETIVFKCNEGMVPENTLTATCQEKTITYPKCITRKKCKSAPVVANGKLKTEAQRSYDSGASVEFECREDTVLAGSINVKCDNGQWSEPPQCLESCKISKEELGRKNVELQLSEDMSKTHKHGSEVNFKCKSGSNRPNRPASLKGECSYGKMIYPRCFTGQTCRLNQEKVDDNFLELDPIHDSEGYYGNGETVLFICKQGFYGHSALKGNCTEGELSYPECKRRTGT